MLLFLLGISPFYLSAQKNYRLLIGTYTGSGVSEGIYSYVVDVESGTFELKSVAAGFPDPSYLALSPDGKQVYAVSESGEASCAGAFSLNAVSGKLSFMNSVPTEGKHPCYIAATDKYVVTANYTGGSISVFGRNQDGSLAALKQLVVHTGKGVDPQRQDRPHVHQVMFTPDKKYLIANDLGTDKVTVYRYCPDEDQVLVPHDSVSVKPGSGPRHVAIGKNGRYVYLLQEMDGTLTVMRLNRGKLKIGALYSVVRKPGVKTGAADIHLSPDGKFLYASNRGTANDITVFRVRRNGKLKYLQQISSGGKGPRNFTITPDGQYLFVGNQHSHEIVILKRDIASGMLSDTGKRIQVGAPVCLIFY